MLGPNQHTLHLANQSYEERLSHSARIRMIQKDRSADQPFVTSTHRALTVRRLAAAGVAGFVLTAALAAAGASAVAASPSHTGGGAGVTLIR
jgi:hypothetical protein